MLFVVDGCFFFFFFKQKTAYEMRISDWSSDVCSSDLNALTSRTVTPASASGMHMVSWDDSVEWPRARILETRRCSSARMPIIWSQSVHPRCRRKRCIGRIFRLVVQPRATGLGRSEEHTSELQSLMRISYAVFCLKKKQQNERTQ